LITVPDGANYTLVQKKSQEWYALGLMGVESFIKQYHKASGGECGLRYFDINTTVTDMSLNCWENGKPAYIMSLEKSSCGLSLSGEPTNNSRVLNFAGNINVSTGANGAFPVSPATAVDPSFNYTLTSVRNDIFLAYVRCANLMGDNCVVDR
jgi:hypothetical protein